MARRVRTPQYTFALDDPPCVPDPPVWKVLVAHYAGATQPGTGGTLLDDFTAAFALPRQDYAPVSRAQAAGLLREYLRFDPVYQRLRATPEGAEACAVAFLERFGESARLFVDAGVAAAGIAAARAAWGLTVVGFDDARVGGIWLADED